MSDEKQEKEAKSKSEIDWHYVHEMEERLNRLEEEKQAKIRVFNPKDLVRSAKEVREVVDDELGTIRYVLLSYGDLAEIIEKYPDNKARSIQLLLRQLGPANKGLTEEDIRALPYEVVVRLLTKLQREGGFFHQQTSPNGSTQTPELKPSGSSPMSTATSFKASDS